MRSLCSKQFKCSIHIDLFLNLARVVQRMDRAIQLSNNRGLVRNLDSDLRQSLSGRF